VPGGEGALGVSVRCGPLTATHLGLRSLAVGPGRFVRAGGRLGSLGATGVLRLGARVTRERFGYLDPLALLGEGAGPPPLPAARAPRAERPVIPRRPVVPVTRRVPTWVPAPSRSPSEVPLAGWIGVALLAGGVGCGALVRRRSHSRRAPAGSVVPGGA
jgi:hypothetical protein